MPKPGQSDSASAGALKNRYRRILRFAAQLLAQSWWFELVLPKFGLRKFAAKGRVKRLQTQARRFRELAADLGGLMVKVGQFLSSRFDVLPETITKELSGLQDEVAPESFDKVLATIERELGMSAQIAFASIESEPIAAASLGQAHRAMLSPGLAADLKFESVVVKILRPGIEDIVDIDLKALRKIGVWLSKVKLVSRRTNAPALVEEFATITLQEVDYLHEAKNLERFAADFAGDARISTPEVIWERSARRVLTLSNVAAIKIGDLAGLAAAGINSNEVAAELARATFEQFFVTGFFHADPHPGNIFVTKSPEGSATNFTITYIDFGMMGELSEQMRSNLQSFLFAVASRDARAWIAACERLGVLLPTVDKVILEDAISKLFDRFGGVRVGELIQTDPKEIREFAAEFSEILRTLPFQLPNDFLFLVRALSLLSGVASSLNQDFNIWDAVDPFARSLLNGGSSSILNRFGKDALAAVNTLAGLPSRIENLFNRLDRGEVVIRNPELEKRVARLNGSTKRVTGAIIFAVLFLGGVALIDRHPEIAYWSFGLSIVPMLYALGFGRISK